MPVPAGYKRNSSGFLQPIGSVPSGRVSGPRAGNTLGMTMEDFGRSPKQKELDAKVLASFQAAQKDHEKIMAGIAKKEADSFKRINDALTASREADAENKDALGNVMPPSAQTEYLEGQLQGLIARGMQKSKALTPGGPGTDPSQFKDGRLITPTPQGPIPGTSDLLNREPSKGPAPSTMEIPQAVGRHKVFGEVELMGERTHPQTGEKVDIIRVKSTGKLQAVRKGEFQPTRQTPSGPFKGLLEDARKFWFNADTPETVTGGGGF